MYTHRIISLSFPGVFMRQSPLGQRCPFSPFYGMVSIAIVHDSAPPTEKRYPCPDTEINSVTPSRWPATAPSEGKEIDGWHHGIPYKPNSRPRLFLGTAGTDLTNILLHRNVYIVTFQGFCKLVLFYLEDYSENGKTIPYSCFL